MHFPANDAPKPSVSGTGNPGPANELAFSAGTGDSMVIDHTDAPFQLNINPFKKIGTT